MATEGKKEDGGCSEYADILKSLIKGTGGDGREEDGETKYTITPKGILYAALLRVYGVDPSVDKFEAFQAEFLKGLSGLSTGGELQDMFGNDFNSFYSLFIDVSNMCGKMRELLEKHGIELEEEEEGKDDN